MLARWVRPGTTVLDIGAGSGALGRYLGTRQGCVVDGVERDLGAAMLSRRSYRRLVVADLEASALTSLFPAGAYDYVFCADILEHLRHPLGVLKDARRLLRQDGHLLISIPNFAYAPLLAELLAGRLQYRPVGLLDDTHVRFVTRMSLEQMLREAGLAPVAVARVIKPAHESEFDSWYLERLPPAVRQFLDGTEEAYTYQFLIDAVAEDERSSSAVLPPQTDPLPLRFVSRLYWRPEGGSYQSELRIEALGEIGGGRQTLRFTLPPETGALGGLLLELADRETILELWSLRVIGPEGPVWSWSGPFGELGRAWCERMALVEPEAPGHAVKAVIGVEPRLHLPVGDRIASCGQGCTVEVELAWPASPEYRRLLDRLPGDFADLAASRRRMDDLIAERDRLGALLEERLAQIQSLTLQLEKRKTRWGFR